MAFGSSIDPVFFRDQTGWRPWKWIRTTYDNLQVPYGKIPYNYLPSKESWINAEVANCVITLPWSLRDAYEEFIIRATTGNVIGALAGLEAFANVLSEKSVANFGLGQEYPPPQLGYCIGNLFKEEVYVKIFAMHLPLIQFVGEANEDIIYRSRFKRMYVLQGEIQSVEQYSVNNVLVPNTYKLNIGIDKIYTDFTFQTPQQIKIVKSDNQFDMIASKILSDGSLIVTYSSPPNPIPSNQIPLVSDYFEFIKPFYIEDPYLMDGYWLGSENEGALGGNTSSYNLFGTTANRPYDEGVITGVYITLNADREPVSFSTGTQIIDSESVKWYFYPLLGNDQSTIYESSTTRFQFIETVGIGGTVSMVPEAIGVATTDELNSFLALNSNFLRLEISRGGGQARTNFHAPCLKNQYIKINNNYYKILYQIDGNVIDVSKTSVNNQTYTLDTSSTNSYSILNQYAWSFNEWYMSNTRTQIYGGTVSYIAATENTNEYIVHTRVTGENSATWATLPPRTYNPSYINPNNFYNRFRLTHDHLESEPIKVYNKGQNWKLYINSVPYNVKSFQYGVEPNSAGQAYAMEYVIEASQLTATVGSQSHISFDTEYSRGSSFNGSLNISLAQGGGQGTSDARLCMQGYWLSPQIKIDIEDSNYYVGICDGKYWGVTDAVALRNDNATLFYSTLAQTSLCTASTYHLVRSDEWVVFNDFYTKNITIRQGDMDYKEHPRKIELSIGESFFKEPLTSSQSGTTINFNTEYNRVKSVDLELPNINTDNPLLFTLGSLTNYYGFFVSGDGGNEFTSLSGTGTTLSVSSLGTDNTTSFTFEDNNISPVYMYKNKQKSATSRNALYLGWDTTKGPLYVLNGSVNKAVVEYIKNNQVLNNIGFFDVHYFNYGEPVIIWGQNTTEFTLTNEGKEYINNSSEAGNTWRFSKNSVMMSGSNNDGITWGNPINLSNFGDNQYPLIIMNSVDYLTSIYNYVSNEIIIIAKCYSESGESYIGSLKMAIPRIIYKKFHCVPSDLDLQMEFDYRPPAMNTLTDTSRTFLPISNIISDGYDWTNSDGTMDIFTRMVGTPAVAETVENLNITTDIANNFNIVSGYCFYEGTIVILLASEGLRAIFSKDGGRSWKMSAIILGRNSSSGIFINGRVFYITDNGIETKFTNETTMLSFIETEVGFSSNIIETKQAEIDNITSNIILSEQIRAQKLSGYITPQGITKIFFYNLDGVLSCVQGYNEKWEIAPNF